MTRASPGRRARRLAPAPGFGTWLLATAVALGVGCGFDWDSLEPSAGPPSGTAGSDAGGSGGDGGTGGSGGSDAGAGTGGADAGGADTGVDVSVDVVEDVVTDVFEDAAPDAVICDEPGGVVWPQNGHCYFVLEGANDTWSTQRDACIASGAHLAVITSQEEDDFAAALVGSTSRWVGLRRTGTGPFTWVTGETSSYTNWISGDPNEQGDACVRMREPDALWTDRACSNDYGAICERP